MYRRARHHRIRGVFETAGVLEMHASMIESKLMQDRGKHIRDGEPILDNRIANVVCSAVNTASFETASGYLHPKAVAA